MVREAAGFRRRGAGFSMQLKTSSVGALSALRFGRYFDEPNDLMIQNLAFVVEYVEALKGAPMGSLLFQWTCSKAQQFRTKRQGAAIVSRTFVFSLEQMAAHSRVEKGHVFLE